MDMTSPDSILDRVRDEYLEMPGLRLTLPQACRLWQLDFATCEAVLGRLVAENVLRRTVDGAYISLAVPRRQLKAALNRASMAPTRNLRHG
jgi:hypothetical protein